MMNLANLLAVIIILTTAIILIWTVSVEIITSKKIYTYLPFFLSGISLCISAALNFYGVYNPKIWFTAELWWGIYFLWILIILKKNNHV